MITTAVRGRNGFLCPVERSWGAATDDHGTSGMPQSGLPFVLIRQLQNLCALYLMKTRLVLAGRSKTEIVQAIEAALDKKDRPALKPGAMAYRTSKHQYLSAEAKHWHPHLVLFVPGDAATSCGANLPGSPLIAANDPEEHATIFLI